MEMSKMTSLVTLIRDPDYVQDFIKRKDMMFLTEYKKTISKKPLTLRQVWQGFHTNTTAHGIPNYERSRGSVKKCFWAILVIAALITVLYNLIALSRDYLSYPSDNVIILNHATSLHFPAVTVCNMNPLKRSAMEARRARSHHRQKRETDWCSADWIEYNSHCYYISTETLSWVNAKLWCENEGASLTKIEDDIENTHLDTIANPTAGDHYWLGLSDVSGSLQWVDGSSPNYTNWDDNDDRIGDCARMTSRGDWRLKRCRDQKFFICEKEYMNYTTGSMQPTADASILPEGNPTAITSKETGKYETTAQDAAVVQQSTQTMQTLNDSMPTFVGVGGKTPPTENMNTDKILITGESVIEAFTTKVSDVETLKSKNFPESTSQQIDIASTSEQINVSTYTDSNSMNEISTESMTSTRQMSKDTTILVSLSNVSESAIFESATSSHGETRDTNDKLTVSKMLFLPTDAVTGDRSTVDETTEKHTVSETAYTITDTKTMHIPITETMDSSTVVETKVTSIIGETTATAAPTADWLTVDKAIPLSTIGETSNTPANTDTTDIPTVSKTAKKVTNGESYTSTVTAKSVRISSTETPDTQTSAETTERTTTERQTLNVSMSHGNHISSPMAFGERCCCICCSQQATSMDDENKCQMCTQDSVGHAASCALTHTAGAAVNLPSADESEKQAIVDIVHQNKHSNVLSQTVSTHYSSQAQKSVTSQKQTSELESTIMDQAIHFISATAPLFSDMDTIGKPIFISKTTDKTNTKNEMNINGKDIATLSSNVELSEPSTTPSTKDKNRKSSQPIETSPSASISEIESTIIPEKSPSIAEPKSDLTDFDNVMETISHMSEQEMLKSGYSSNELIVDCRYSGQTCDYRNFGHIINHVHGNCFVFNSGWPNTTTVDKSKRTGRRFGLHMVLNVNQKEYPLSGTDTVGVRVVVHSRDRMPFPEDEGVTVSPGRATSIAIRQVELEYLPLPHGDCMNTSISHEDINMFEEKYPVSYSTKACKQTCYQRHVIQTCGCGDPSLPRTGTAVSNVSVPVCSTTNHTQEGCRAKVNSLIFNGQIDCNCPIPCHSIVNTMGVSVGQWPSRVQRQTILKHLAGKIGDSFDITDSKAYRGNLVKLEIFYEDFNYESVRQRPKFKTGGLLSNIGGMLGLWVGFSVFTIIELVEVFFNVILAMIYNSRSNMVGASG